MFIIDRSLLAAPVTLTLSTTGYPLPADRMVHVSIIGAGPDVTLSVPGVGTTNHGGTAAVMRVFERGASGWIEH